MVQSPLKQCWYYALSALSQFDWSEAEHSYSFNKDMSLWKDIWKTLGCFSTVKKKVIFQF